MISSGDGVLDRNNWFLSDNYCNSGRSLATYKVHLLVKYAKENKMFDLEINTDNINKKLQSERI